MIEPGTLVGDIPCIIGHYFFQDEEGGIGIVNDMYRLCQLTYVGYVN